MAGRGSIFFCFERILIYTDLKLDPPRRPREMRIIDPRRSRMFFVKHQTGKNFPPSDEHFPYNHFDFLMFFSSAKSCLHKHDDFHNIVLCSFAALHRCSLWQFAALPLCFGIDKSIFWQRNDDIYSVWAIFRANPAFWTGAVFGGVPLVSCSSWVECSASDSIPPTVHRSTGARAWNFPSSLLSNAAGVK